MGPVQPAPLTLSNASSRLLTGVEATWTIENRDPLPRALLARFGRATAVHPMEHVKERIEAPQGAGLLGPLRWSGAVAGNLRTA